MDHSTPMMRISLLGFFWALCLVSVEAQEVSNAPTAFSERAKKIPIHRSLRLKSIARYLKKDTRSEQEFALNAYTWMTHHIRYDWKRYNRQEPGILKPKWLIWRRKALCVGYANLFEAIMEHGEVKAYKVSGYSKGGAYSPGDTLRLQDHAWSGWLADGDWMVCDASWGSGYIDLKRQRLAKFFYKAFGFQYTVKYHFVRNPDLYWYRPDPLTFTADHLPGDPAWQLLNRPVTMKDWESAGIEVPERTGRKTINFRDSLQARRAVPDHEEELFDALRINHYNPHNHRALAIASLNYANQLSEKNLEAAEEGNLEWLSDSWRETAFWYDTGLVETEQSRLANIDAYQKKKARLKSDLNTSVAAVKAQKRAIRRALGLNGRQRRYLVSRRVRILREGGLLRRNLRHNQLLIRTLRRTAPERSEKEEVISQMDSLWTLTAQNSDCLDWHVGSIQECRNRLEEYQDSISAHNRKILRHEKEITPAFVNTAGLAPYNDWETRDLLAAERIRLAGERAIIDSLRWGENRNLYQAYRLGRKEITTELRQARSAYKHSARVLKNIRKKGHEDREELEVLMEQAQLFIGMARQVLLLDRREMAFISQEARQFREDNRMLDKQHRNLNKEHKAVVRNWRSDLLTEKRRYRAETDLYRNMRTRFRQGRTISRQEIKDIDRLIEKASRLHSPKLPEGQPPLVGRVPNKKD